MNHDCTFNQATSSASVAAVIASLDPQIKGLNSYPSKSNHVRPSSASRSLSHLSRIHDGHKPSYSEDTSSDMLALLRPGSRCTTASSKSSTTNESARPVSPATVVTSSPAPCTTPCNISIHQSTPPRMGNTLIDASSTSTSSLSPRARRHLLRSARKVGHILGEMPILCTSASSRDMRQTTLEASELGVLSSSPSVSSHSSSSNDAGVKRMNSLNITSRPRLKTETGTYDGVAQRRYTALTVEDAPAPFAPNLSRIPPVLKVDCSFIPRSSKPARQVAPDADARSFVSTTTTTSTASDPFGPITAQRSPLTPTRLRSTLGNGTSENLREARRSKVAKLSRHLGERVPVELVFPAGLQKMEETESYVLITSETSPPVSPLTDKMSTPERKVIEPPTRSSSLKRRKRTSLRLDLGECSDATTSTPSTSSSASTQSFGSTSSKYRPARALSRSRSIRSRPRKQRQTSAIVQSSSDTLDAENIQLYLESAPAIRTVYESAAEDDPNAKQVKDEGEGEDKVPGPSRSPLGDAQKQLNIRRAQKMLSMFGDAPPNTLLHVSSKCESPSALGRSVMGGARFKRHSISSIMTAGSSLMLEPREAATFDSPISPSPKTARPRESLVTPTRTPTSRDSLKPPTPPSVRRRASLSALPDTPPPFAQYFHPSAPPSPISPLAGRQQAQEQGWTGGIPKISRLSSGTHSPTTSSGSSDPPSTPRFGPDGQEEPPDPGAAFRERRLRAAKLARFFGVGYGDLYPACSSVDEGIIRLSRSSFDSFRSARSESVEKEIVKVKERERKLVEARTKLSRVSVTVQREVDPGIRATPSSSTSSLPLTTEEIAEEARSNSTGGEIQEAEVRETAESPSPDPLPPLTTTTSISSKNCDVSTPTTGCYSTLSFNSGRSTTKNPNITSRRRGGGVPLSPIASPTASERNPTSSRDMNESFRQRGGGVPRSPIKPTPEKTSKHKMGLGLNLSANMFSLGRQSRRAGAGGNSGHTNSVSLCAATLGRKNSNRAGGVRALTIGERRSLFSRSSCSEFGNGKSQKEQQEQQQWESNLTGPRVRVGEKIADVSEVMMKLRQLR